MQADHTKSPVRTVATNQSLLRSRIMQLALAFIFTLLTGCAESRLDQRIDPESRTNTAADQTDSSWTEERKALYHQAQEGLRQSRERYLATTRPILESKFRQEYPMMTDDEIEALVTDALAKGYHHEAESRPEGPARLPPQRPMNCMPSPGGWPSSSNCY